jgi:hypothetical protein
MLLPHFQAQTVPAHGKVNSSRNFTRMARHRLPSSRVRGRKRHSPDTSTSIPAPFPTWLFGVLISWILFLSSPASPVLAGPKVSCEVSIVSQHTALVTFTWNVKVASEKAWDACDLIISFQNDKGQEIYSVRQTIGVRIGQSSFSGTEICDSDVWKRMKKYVAVLDCVF